MCVWVSFGVSFTDLSDRSECQAEERNADEEKKEITWLKWNLPLEKIT